MHEPDSTHGPDIEPIAPLESNGVSTWDHAADVIVVGLGCAGACATVEAAESGADVLAVEAAPMGGGTSAMSGGIIYLGGGTPIQQACGFEDSPEQMERFLTAACGPGVDQQKLHHYCRDSVGHFGWLVDHGVPFEARYHPEHDREPDDDSGLCYSGGEDASPFNALAVPAPRGHNPKFPDAAGGFLMQRLLAAVSDRGADVLTDTTVERLITDSSGVVVGVKALVDGEPTMLRARKGVVLTAGGFTFNEAMVRRYCPDVLRVNVPIGTEYDDGRAIRMAQGVGAATDGMEHIEVGIPLTPPRSLVRGILVNGSGERFINEDTYAGRVGKASLLDQDGIAYFVHSDETFAVNIAGYKAKWVAETPGQLEAEIGLPTGSLTKTVAAYNQAAARQEDPEFHKGAEWVIPLEPPYGVVDMRVEASFYASFTLGGLATNADGEVLDDSGTAVPGLFAAGRTTAGLAGSGYVSGISLGDGTYFGRRAGRSAAAR
ncbi:MAG: FAD-dependent oxidoreductase [Microthrixaceae bacterium]